MKKILILSANPRGDLRIDREIRDLKKVIESNKNSEQFDVKTELATKIEDLDEIIYDNQPYIVHFCGHGAGEQGLVFENNQGVEQRLSNEALVDLFKISGKDVKCLLLNACHTEIQANLIAEHISYGIGTNREISDEAAYWFSIGFYKALVRELPIETCYDWGCYAVKRIVLNPNTVKIVLNDSDQFRKMEVIEEDGSKVTSEPLKIILKRKTVRENKLQTTEVSASIPSELEKEIIEEGNRKKYYDNLRDVLDRFGQTSIKPKKPISKFEYCQRQTLLKKVHKFWIKGFLKPSLCFSTTIDKDKYKEDPSGKIFRPLTKFEDILINNDESYDKLRQTNIIDRINQGRILRILGEPGSGKTIFLLQLAERLIELMPEDMTKPIPVVFNLSSWGQKQQSLKEWLIEELKDKYQVPKTWSESWIEQEQLILLLDGLDEIGAGLEKEIAKEQQNACVRAINEFSGDRWQTEIAICSRVKDYKALDETLLSSAICIQPLSQNKLLEFLKNADDSLLGFKNAIEQNREIAEFAKIPLFFNIMTWTYQGCSAGQCYWKFDRYKDDRESNLFELYIDWNLNQEIKQSQKAEDWIFLLLSALQLLPSKANSDKYSKNKVKHWLSWLAKTMVAESTTIFLIEKLQPTLLQSRKEQIIYRCLNGFFVGLVIAIVVAIVVFEINFGINNFQLTLSIRKVIYPVIISVTYGEIISFILLQKIITFEEISWKWLSSWQKTKPMISFMLIVSIVCAIIYGLIQKQINVVELISIFIGGIINIPIHFIFNALNNSELADKTEPNQGIWLSGYNCIRFGSISGLIGGLVCWLLVVAIGFVIGIPIAGLKYGLIIGLGLGIIIGMIVGMIYGGAACIQHFSLRLILWFKRKPLIPWDYAHFLNYASDRLLMKKVGGGYVFYHRMLMEHFAERNQESKR